MTQFIGWTTTHKPLNLKDWPLYMTQYIWSYSFAAQSKLMPNFEAKIKCNTIKPNVPKWRKTCTGLKFDLLDFYGPQSNIHTF